MKLFSPRHDGVRIGTAVVWLSSFLTSELSGSGQLQALAALPVFQPENNFGIHWGVPEPL